MKILVIDDSPVNVRVLTSVLETGGYMVLQALSGKMGLKIASNAKPDLIFLDIRMPDMDGFEVCRQLKSDKDLLDIPVIFLSGLTEASEKVEAFQAGGVDYIVKPIQSEEVLARTRNHLELHQMKSSLEVLVKERTRELEETNQTLKDEIRHRLLAEEKLKLDEERLESLIKLNEMTTHSEKEIIVNVLENAIRLTRSNVGYFCYVVEDKVIPPAIAWPENRLDDEADNPVISPDILFECIRLNKPMIHNEFQMIAGINPIIRYMFVPVHDETSIFAIIGVANKPTDYLDADERQLTLLSQGMLRLIQRIRSDVERKKLEVQLRQAQKMEAIGTLAGGIAHDFNNILSPILCYAEMEMAASEKNSKTQKRMNGIYQAGLRARDLVRQILTFSREKETDVRPIEIQPVIKEALKLLKSSLPSTIYIKQDIHENCGAVNGDPIQIHQIIMNLCTNAYHAMKETGGELSVGLCEILMNQQNNNKVGNVQSGPYILLSVSDTGQGMTKQIIERIFDPYFTTKDIGEGTGLGLSIVHGIVKNMGGFIDVYSEPGKGSSFKIYFPQIKSKEKEYHPHEIDIPGGSERILVVDDDPAVADVVGQMLVTIGYTVTVKSDSIDALKMFEESPDSFDLVISDLTMPGINGLELSKKILSIKNHIPIIICTGFTDAINNEMIKNCGVRFVIMKPVVSWELAKTIRRALEKPPV